LFRNVNQKKEN